MKSLTQQFLQQKRTTKVAVGLIGFLFLIAVFANFIANEKPFYCSYHGNTYFPVFNTSNLPKELTTSDWKKMRYDAVIWSPIAFSANTIDFQNSQYQPPLSALEINGKKWHHWLGTSALGEDVSAGIIHGTRQAFVIGLLSMLIALLIGGFLGIVSGYFGDDAIAISKAEMLLILLAIIPSWFYGFVVRSFALQDAATISWAAFATQFFFSVLIAVCILTTAYFLGRFLSQQGILTSKTKLPLDIIISRFTEIFSSLPRLLLIFFFAAIAHPSITNVILIIGLTSWTEFTRFTRAEMLKIRSQAYIESVNSLGIPVWRIIIFHALPNAMPPIIIALAFGISGAILAESTLSFLGIGVPANTVTWGSLLAHSRESISSWWMAVFPGIFIFITIMSFNLIGDSLSKGKR
ncbi:MAG: ABC transporter permease [Bacteroidetes bacterium]|nr:ABC transporter permease [Bacteroidota bacterium]